MTSRLGAPWSERSSRLLQPGLVVLVFVLTAASVAYLAIHVPLHTPLLSAADFGSAWPVAATSLLLVTVLDAFFLALLVGRPEQQPGFSPRGRGLSAALDLSVGRVPRRALAITTAASGVLLVEALWLGFPLWTVVLVVLIPWIALYFGDARRRFTRFGAYAVFGSLVVLQLGHLGEHVAQNVQLLMTHSVQSSRGILGQLDIESVHAVWNLLVWLGTAYLLWTVGRRNPWLWLAFAAASFHSIEHVYLYWLYVADHPLYLRGGSNGILAQHGLLPTALARPYLHLLYNVVEVTPLVAAFWWQLTRSDSEDGLSRAAVPAVGSTTVGSAG